MLLPTGPVPEKKKFERFHPNSSFASPRGQYHIGISLVLINFAIGGKVTYDCSISTEQEIFLFPVSKNRSLSKLWTL